MGLLFFEWFFCKGVCLLGMMLFFVGGFGKGFFLVGFEVFKIVWGFLVVVFVLLGVFNGFFYNVWICFLRKLIFVKSLLCCFFKVKLDCMVLVCFFWRDWFFFCSFLIWVDCCDSMFWSNLICNERLDEILLIVCFWSFRRLFCCIILFFICWRLLEFIIWNWVKFVFNWLSVFFSDEIVFRWLGVIVKGLVGGVDKVVFVVIVIFFCVRLLVVLEEGILFLVMKWIELVKKLWSDDVKIDLFWIEEIFEKFLILFSLFIFLWSIGNLCVF